MIIPSFLKENDTIGLVSPAGKIDSIVIENAINYLESKKLRCVVALHAADSYNQFSSTDELRAEDLQTMFNNPDIKAIWCTRGGYGSMRLIDKLDFSILEKYPKWLIGFSDITVFHSVLREKVGLASVHGAMCLNLSAESLSESGMDNLWKLLFGELPMYQSNHLLNRKGNASGILIGGNLSLMCALIGSPYDFDPKGKILFIEDVGEYLYRLDRMMQSLKISGKLSGLSGLIAGQFSDIKDNETPFGKSAYEIISEAVAEYNYPVIYDFPAGHSKRNEPLLLGVKVEIKADAKIIFFSK